MDDEHETMMLELKDAIDMGDFEPTEWEEQFIESIGDQLPDKALTEAQSDKLKEIYNKAFLS